MPQEVSRTGALLPLLLATAVGVLACTVMAGWWLDWPALVQLHASFVPMQFNTALCFLAVSSALVAAMRDSRSITRTLGAFMVLLAAATLAQYGIDVDLGIDELLQRHDITTRSPYPGRMAHATAFGFVLIGLSTILLTFRQDHPAPRIAAETLAALTVSISLVAIVGYITGIEQAYGWGQITSMALHSALGFLFIGLANLLFSLHHAQPHPSLAWRRTFVPLAIITLATSLSLWQALKVHEERGIADATRATRQAVQIAFVLETEGRVRALKRMAARGVTSSGPSRQAWEADAQQYTRDDFSLVGWMDRNNKLKWSAVAATAADNLLSDDFVHVRFARLCAAAQATQAPAVGGLLRDGFRTTSLLAAIPLVVHSGSDGCIVAVSKLSLLHEYPSLLEEKFGFRIAPADDAQMPAALLELDPAIRLVADSGTLIAHGVPWNVSAWPTQKGLDEMRTPLPDFILAFGVIATCLLLTALGFYRVAAHRSAELAAGHDRLLDVKAKLERLALFDSLTNIGNRNLFLSSFQATLAAAEQESLPAALLVLDLNGFKDVNDQLGHKAGDSVLVTIASRLTHIVGERGEAFRIGGDEFSVVLNAGCDEAEALEIARSIARGVSEPIALYGESRKIGASIGVASFPRHGRDVDAMIRKADVAMYEAKALGQPVVASLDMGATTVLRLKHRGREPGRGRNE
jgi:diguanylate cyclase (GGDEF)-like protein